MLILTQTTDKIQVVLAGAITTNQLPFMASYRDITTSAFTPGRNAGLTNNTTDVDMVTAPAASTQRVVDFLNVFNNDTVSATVTVKLDLNGTEYILFKAVLATGETMAYQEGSGFKVYANSGAIKTSLNQGNSPVGSGPSRVVLGSDVINNNATANTIADVTGLSFAVNSGTRYYFLARIRYTAAATTTGSRWAVNGPTQDELMISSRYSLTTTSWTFNEVVGYDLPAASNASSANTTGNFCFIQGIIRPTANGTVIIRFASEVSNSAITAKAGSFLEYFAI